MGKYKKVKEIILQKLNEEGEISQKEVIALMKPYVDIDIEKLKEQELGRIAYRLIASYEKCKSKE